MRDDTLTCAMLGHREVVAEHRDRPVFLCVCCGRVTPRPVVVNDSSRVIAGALGILAAVLIAWALLVMTASPSDAGTQPVPAWMSRPCAQEDSVNCYWDARTSGNGAGWSFYTRRFPGGTVCTFYVSHPRSDYCAKG